MERRLRLAKSESEERQDDGRGADKYVRGFALGKKLDSAAPREENEKDRGGIGEKEKFSGVS